MTRARSPIVSFVTLTALAVLVTIAGCGDSSPGSERAAEIYGAVVRAIVPPDDDSPDVTRDVFIGGGEDGVPLDLQADVLQELKEYQRLRFVDDRSEAVHEDPPHLVRNGGVFLEMGSVPEKGTTVTIDALRYVSDDDEERLRLRVHRTEGTWTVEEKTTIG